MLTFKKWRMLRRSNKLPKTPVWAPHSVLLVAAAVNWNVAWAEVLDGRYSYRLAEAYIDRHGGTLAPAGALEIDGRRVSCGPAPTVLDTHYDDFGGSIPGFLIINPNLFAGLAKPVKLWIYSHECAHQITGNDEAQADCHAVQRGHREGWLSISGLHQVCEFMKPANGDQSHFTGTQRCGLMLQCFDTRKRAKDHP